VTEWERLVHDHTGLNFHEIGDLPLDAYLNLRRDAYLFMLGQTEEGRKYLEQCWIMDQTSPDRGALREKHGRRKRR
jgi:hypothetical protein